MSGCVTQPKHFVAVADRSASQGREAIVVVPQGEIRADVVAANGGAAFGLVGAIVDVSVNQHRANKAEAAIAPLRTGLNDYGFDQKVLAATKNAFAKVDWLGVRATSFSKDGSVDNTNAVLDKSQAPQVLFAVYSYQLSADFSTMDVSAHYSILSKTPPSGESLKSRAQLKNALYSRFITYQAALANPSDAMDDNCARWTRNGSELARKALDQGIDSLATLFERSLLATSDTEDKTASRSRATGAVKNAKVLETSDAGTLYFDALGNWTWVSSTTL